MTAYREVPAPRGGRLVVHVLGGDEAAPALVLCHATGFSGLSYRTLGEALSKRFFVVAPDFAGHGDSSPAPDYDWSASAGDLLAVVDALRGGGPVVGFGHSFGGSVLLLAERARPGAIQQAYCYEPIVLPDEPPDPSPGASLAEAARRRRPAFASRAEALARYASRRPLDTLQAGVLADYVTHAMREREDGSVELKCTPEVEAASFEAGGKPTLSMLSHVTVPVTVAVGGLTSGPTAAFAVAAAKALPAARLERHDFLGHFGPLEQPAAVAASALRALSADEA